MTIFYEINLYSKPSILECVLLQAKINFLNINHLDFGITLEDSGMPFAANQLQFQNRGFSVIGNDEMYAVKVDDSYFKAPTRF